MPKAKEKDDIAKLFERVASTADGVRLLRHILSLTNYDKPIMRYDAASGELNNGATIYNLSKRDVWLAIRQHLSPQSLAIIENSED